MNLKIKKIFSTAKLPTRYHQAAGYDLYANELETHIYPGDTATIGTGIAMAIPSGLAGFILPRSGLGAKQGIVLGNLTGLIDEDYRGEILINVWNRNVDGPPFIIRRYDKIAQMVFLEIQHPYVQVVTDLDKTNRGVGGFGSSG